ncbi:MAG: transcriptional antiterminator, Rof [Gammaproteobacteria bacterium]|nr:transcriptional antiterminator, Rof [Gammaproteobacteria bacterium]
MSNDDSYTPIPCAAYDTYEIAIMHGELLQLVWKDELNQHNISVLKPLDLQTREGAEFLIAKTDEGKTLQLRLDHIQSCKTIDHIKH